MATVRDCRRPREPVAVQVGTDGQGTTPPYRGVPQISSRRMWSPARRNTAAGVYAGFVAARKGMRPALDRRRFAQWNAERDRVEPLWSARFHR